jgi:hypothetical protein
MVTSPTTKTKAAAASKTTRRKPVSGTSHESVKVRMYRQGLGDCFLVTLPREGAAPFYLMIDCGVILGTMDAAAKMQNVVKDIIKTTNGHIDLLIATHEHWDHLSGFVQARELFDQLQIDQVWLGWPENPDDTLAQQVRAEHQALRLALTSASARMRLDGSGNSLVDGMLEFFGAAGQGTTSAAMEVVRKLGCNNAEPRYCLPSDDPVEFTGTGVRAYVLGPPHDKDALKRSNPSRSHPETYGFAASFLNQLAPVFTDGDRGAPFDPIRQIPLEMARQMPFFQNRYWGADADSPDNLDQSWRQIDADWLDVSSNLALQLDTATNNTSLVIGLELPNREVLLFAADAQVGNWLSWQDLDWTVGGEKVAGPDLLSRTVFYKVGHHGSHNATLREKGLELMTNLKIACLPVDHDMAVKKRWGKMPLAELETRLNVITNGGVLRIDQAIPSALSGCVQPDDEQILYYEVKIGN